MATSNTDCFIPSTKEYRVLQKYFNRLMHAISDPVTLAAELYSTNLISESTRMKANAKNSSHSIRCYHLLDGLMATVALVPANFMKIITVLQCHPPVLSAIAEEMKRDHGKSYNSNIQ